MLITIQMAGDVAKVANTSFDVIALMSRNIYEVYNKQFETIELQKSVAMVIINNQDNNFNCDLVLSIGSTGSTLDVSATVKGVEVLRSSEILS